MGTKSSKEEIYEMCKVGDYNQVKKSISAIHPEEIDYGKALIATCNNSWWNPYYNNQSNNGKKVKIAELLLSKGAVDNGKVWQKSMDETCKSGYVDIAKLLLKNLHPRYLPSRKHIYSHFLFAACVHSGKLEMVKLFINTRSRILGR